MQTTLPKRKRRGRGEEKERKRRGRGEGEERERRGKRSQEEMIRSRGGGGPKAENWFGGYPFFVTIAGAELVWGGGGGGGGTLIRRPH